MEKTVEKISVQKLFICLAALFGVLFVVLVPPFQVPDEDSHFKKAYVMAYGQFYPSVEDGREGFYLSQNMTDFISEKLSHMSDWKTEFEYGENIIEERVSVSYDDLVLQEFSTVSFDPIGHIVPAAGILVGRFVGYLAGRSPSATMLLYFARMANLLLYILLIAVSIRLTPVLKKTFCMLGLMPMAISLAASPSYDMPLIAGAFLFTAITFRLMFDKEAGLRIRYAVAYGIIAFLFFKLKIVYMPLYLLLIFLPWKSYQKNEWLKKLGIIAGVFAGLVILSALPSLLLPHVDKIQDPRIGEQLQYVLHNPMDYLHTLYLTIKKTRDFYVTSTIGMFGLVDTYLYSVFVYGFALLLLLTGIADASRSGVTVKWYYRVTILAAAAMAVFGVFLAMYINWTPLMPGYGVAADRITGVQGRYFLPLLPACVAVFVNKQITKTRIGDTICSKIVAYSPVASVAILSASCVMLMLRYWA